MLALPAMQRKPDTPHLALPTSFASLSLLLPDALDPALHAWLQQNVEALVEPLRPWGKFRQPVLLEPVADAAALSADLPQPSHLELRAVAALDRVRFVLPSTPDELLSLLHHELGHVQCFQRCTPPHGRIPYLPTWFREGLALRVAHGRPEPQARRPLAAHPQLALLPNADDAQIARDPTATYALAVHLFTAWHDRYGTLGLTGLYAALRQGHPFATAFQRSCQMRANEYVDAWLAAVRREARSK
jgi:hypothetical protein